MKKLTSTLILIVISVISFAQSAAHTCSRMKIHSHNSQTRSNTLSLDYIALTEEYDVHFYFLDVELENTSTDIAGTVEIHGTSKVSLLDTILFELHDNLTINSLSLNGTPAIFNRVGSAVIVESNLTSGDNFVVSVNYDGTPPDAATNPLGGGGMTNDSSPSWGNQVTWSLSEPFSAFEWWPCKQSLTDKADSLYVFITTTSTNKAGSNGVLTDVVDLGNGKERYEWKSNYPIDYYLVSVAVAEYVEYNIYANPTGAANPILIQNYIYNNPATLNNFQNEIDNTADFLEYFSQLYGMYPFENEKYGHCMAPLSGGMEHQTMTTQGWFENGLTAHELGHQWWGNNVTCATWADIWLNEGFASYSDYLMVENFAPNDAPEQMEDIHDNVMSENGGSVYCLDSLNSNRIFSGRLSYDKGAAIVHTLRFIINDDDTFFDILKKYQLDFTDSTARLNDFKIIAESVSGMDFTAFFNEWYYGEGYPTYNLEWNKNNSQVFIEVNQNTSMSGVTPLFTNDLEIKVNGTDGSTTTERFSINTNNQIVAVAFEGDVESLEIDPNNWIINKFGTITENNEVLSVIDNESKLLIYPNPATETLFINNQTENSEVIIYSLDGKVVKSQILTLGQNKVDIKSLDRGTYMVKLGDYNQTLIIQ